MTERNVIDDAATHGAEPGLDHSWFAWSPLPSRPPLRWPGEADVAVSVVIDLGAVEWEDPDQPVPIPPLGGRGFAAYPDFPRMSHREFGHRVGVFRLLRSLAQLDIAPAVVVDVLTVEHYGRLIDHVRPVAAEWIAGGLSQTRPITSLMSEAEESHYITSTLERLEAGLAVRPSGWLGPERGESPRTPGLLARAGVGYVADWCNDEQPYPMADANGDLWAFPLSWELSDVSAVHVRGVSPDDYARSLIEAFDVMRADGRASGRVLGLHLQPWLSGQPFMIRALSEALRHLRGHDQAWFATPLEVVEWCRRAR